MTETEVTAYLTSAFENVSVLESGTGHSFFYYGPMGEGNMWPFVTLVTSDEYDDASNLNREGVYRLNLGLSKVTFLALFGDDSETETNDATVLDRVLPHPIYGKQYWVCVLSPSDATFESQVKPLLAEAYERAAAKQDNTT